MGKEFALWHTDFPPLRILMIGDAEFRTPIARISSDLQSVASSGISVKFLDFF